MFSCTYCCYKSKDKISFVKHLFQAHSSESTFKYACTILPCSRIFVSGDSFGAFRSHCERYHHNWRERFSQQEEEEHRSHHELDSDDMDVSTQGTTPHSASEDLEPHFDPLFATDVNCCVQESADFLQGNGHINNNAKNHSDHDFVLKTAKFILNLKEKFKLTQVCLDFILQSVEELLSILTDGIKQSVMRRLRETNVDTSKLSDDFFMPVDLFKNLKTEYHQTKFYKENFNLIVRITLLCLNCSKICVT